jgi:3-phenylpropionate/trans-cinnamate dioxygenase ferredoxin subunit
MSDNDTEFDPLQFEFVAVAGVNEIGSGERIFVDVDEFSLVVFNIAGKFFAIADLCSHDDGPLGDGEIEDHAVICPRHGARFDLRNGKALSLPAVVDIPAYPVRVRDGQVEVGLPIED